MQTDAEFELSVDIRCIKSSVTDYIRKHKTVNHLYFNNDIMCSRIDFIIFQFKNVFI